MSESVELTQNPERELSKVKHGKPLIMLLLHVVLLELPINVVSSAQLDFKRCHWQ